MTENYTRSHAAIGSIHSPALSLVLRCLNAGSYGGIAAYQDAVTALLPDVLPASELTDRYSQNRAMFAGLTDHPPYAPNATWRGLFASLYAVALTCPDCRNTFVPAVTRVAGADIPRYVDSNPNTGGTGRYSGKPGTYAGWVTVSVLSLAQTLADLVPDHVTIEQAEAWDAWARADAQAKALRRFETVKDHALADAHRAHFSTTMQQRAVRIDHHKTRADYSPTRKHWRHH